MSHSPVAGAAAPARAALMRAALACAALSSAVAGCGGADRAAGSATVRTAPPGAADSLLLGPEEISGLVGKRLTVRGEYRRPNDEGSHTTPDYCEAVAKTGASAAPSQGWTFFHELDLDENVTEQSKREHYANGLTVDETVVEYPDEASAAAAQRTVAEAARRCSGQTVVIDYNGTARAPWHVVLAGSGPMSTSWDFENAGAAWTCSSVGARRAAALLHVMVCRSSGTRETAAKIADRILDDRA